MATPDTQPLAGLRVLVTRPALQAQPLCQLIERAGGVALPFPTIEIVPPTNSAALEAIVDRLHDFDLAIFVSPNAVTYAMQTIRVRRDGLPPNITVACVGYGSAHRLAEFGIKDALIPAHADSEGLLELAPLQQVKNKNIVIFRGEGGRELLAQTLRERAAHVTYAECYRRRRPQTDTAALARLFVQDSIDVVTVTSADALRNLIDMVGNPAVARLTRTPLVVISARLRDIAQELGFNGPLQVAMHASDEGIVDAIRAWHGSQKNL